MKNKHVRTPIIYYHEVVEDKEGFSYQKIEKSVFEEQMKYLQTNGFHSLFFSNAENAPSEKSVIVSFDDGFRSVYDAAFPIMKKYNIKGVVYLASGYVGHDKYLSVSQIEEMQQSGLFSFEAHTHTHPDIRSLSMFDFKEEVEKSDAFFKEHFHYLPEIFCIPFGAYNGKAIRMIKQENRYRYILASYYGLADFHKSSGNLLPRIGIKNEDSLTVFQDKLAGKYNWKGPLQRLKLFVKSLFGERHIDENFE